MWDMSAPAEKPTPAGLEPSRRTDEASVADQMGDLFAAAGLPRPIPADNDRVGGWMLMYQMLDAGEWLLTENCVELIRTIPNLVRDAARLEDIEKMVTTRLRVRDGRDQAMGRIGLVWRRMKFFHADIMLLAVDCFRRNRPNDVEVTLLGAGATFESQWIRLAELKGNLFGYPETDEQYPTLWSQQRAVLLQLIAKPDPQIQAVLAHPENMALVKRLIGLEEFVIPDEESRTKQYREIAQLVAEMPLVKRQDVTSVVNPAFQDAVATGVDAEIILPSIMPDEFAGNHAVELETSMRWF
jgi:hypothetical protein